VPRAEILTIALLSVHIALGLLCLAAARTEDRAPGLTLWGWGLIAYALGLAASVSGLPTRPAGLFIGNTVIAGSAILTVKGALHYTKRGLDRVSPLVGLGLAALVLAWGNFVANPPNQGLNIVVPTIMATVLFVHAGIALLRAPQPDAARAARLVAAVLLVAVATWWARILAMPSIFNEPIDRQRLDAVIAGFAIAQILVGVVAAFGLFWMEVSLSRAAMARMAFTDSLTGLANRRAIVERFADEAARMRRQGGGLALAVFDLDHFKQTNDSHGHLVGDAVLTHVGRVLAAGKRGGDVLGRIGGEEFVMLMADPLPGGAHLAADRLRHAIESTSLLHEGLALTVTVSGGVARFPQDGETWDALFSVADRRLYEAKRAGRNRVVSAEAA
jgi:diguanylate cyclase (GGDEF)-like protein